MHHLSENDDDAPNHCIRSSSKQVLTQAQSDPNINHPDMDIDDALLTSELFMDDANVRPTRSDAPSKISQINGISQKRTYKHATSLMI